MQSVLDSLFQQIVAQGFSITLLSVGNWYFYREIEKNKKALEESKRQIVRYLEEDRTELVQLVDELKEIVKQNTAILSRIERKI